MFGGKRNGKENGKHRAYTEIQRAFDFGGKSRATVEKYICRMTTIEDVLNSKGFILETPVGNSMRPMLHNKKEQLVIQKISRPLKTNDVVLFKRNNGQYVLHRIVKNNKEYFMIRGDNCLNYEHVDKKQVIGLLSGFYRNDKYIDCNKNVQYILYRKKYFEIKLYENLFVYGTITSRNRVESKLRTVSENIEQLNRGFAVPLSRCFALQN